MGISAICIRRPVFTIVLSLLIVTAGCVAFAKLPLRHLPAYDEPTVTVVTELPGASAGQIEAQVSTILEVPIAALAGVKKVTSTSFVGQSMIEVTFRDDVQPLNAANEVGAKAQATLPQLPGGNKGSPCHAGRRRRYANPVSRHSRSAALRARAYGPRPHASSSRADQGRRRRESRSDRRAQICDDRRTGPHASAHPHMAALFYGKSSASIGIFTPESRHSTFTLLFRLCGDSRHMHPPRRGHGNDFSSGQFSLCNLASGA